MWECKPPGFIAAELDVSDLVRRPQDPAALVVYEREHATLGNGILQRRRHLIRFGIRLNDELTRHGLYPDLDFHSAPLSTSRLARGPGPCVKPASDLLRRERNRPWGRSDQAAIRLNPARSPIRPPANAQLVRGRPR